MLKHAYVSIMMYEFSLRMYIIPALSFPFLHASHSLIDYYLKIKAIHVQLQYNDDKEDVHL